jgi:hypothetical protein
VSDPPVWGQQELETERLAAISAFRKERLQEPLADYLEAFDFYRTRFEEFLHSTGDLAQLDDQALAVLTDPHLLEAFRYLAAPPISEDDLQVLAEAPTLAKVQLKKNPEYVKRLVGTVRLVLDRRRFAWVAEGRGPSEIERSSALTASAALLATSRVQTKRRTNGKAQQEALVKRALADAGLKEVRRRTIPNVTLAPAAGEFCGESLLGLSRSDPKADKGRLADIVLRLWDHRLMPIECKVSNSYLNSLKRLNNDAAVKAGTWKRDFGVHQVVPAAVLSGVYDIHNLLDAQARGLTIFWAHNLKPLTDFLAGTR